MGDIGGNFGHDAARANWGGSWRMPTKEEFQELFDNCTWERTTKDVTSDAASVQSWKTRSRRCEVIMNTYISEISDFLRESGFDCVAESRGGMSVLWTQLTVEGEKMVRRCIVPWPIVAESIDEAYEQTQRMDVLLKELSAENHKTIVVTEDRWRIQQLMMKSRLLAHLEVFTPMFARNCEVRKIDKETAAEFLDKNHSYGDAACKYRYGLYLKRYTGKRGTGYVEPGTLVAVATFSNARKWQKVDKTIRSYEWTRYASLPGVRINGGMGKMLKAFIKDVQPDDIMSYADLEWSEGAVYEQLGFVLEGKKAPVVFVVDGQWGRFPVKQGMTEGADKGMTEVRFLQNLGSNKYRLKLTEYE